MNLHHFLLPVAVALARTRPGHLPPRQYPSEATDGPLHRRNFGAILQITSGSRPPPPYRRQYGLQGYMGYFTGSRFFSMLPVSIAAIFLGGPEHGPLTKKNPPKALVARASATGGRDRFKRRD